MKIWNKKNMNFTSRPSIGISNTFEFRHSVSMNHLHERDNRLEMRDAGMPDARTSDFTLRSKTKGLKRTGPKLDGDRFDPFCGTNGLSSVWSTDLRSFFGLPYLGSYS